MFISVIKCQKIVFSQRKNLNETINVYCRKVKLWFLCRCGELFTCGQELFESEKSLGYISFIPASFWKKSFVASLVTFLDLFFFTMCVFVTCGVDDSCGNGS